MTLVQTEEHKTMKTYKRETARQGIIRDASATLAKSYPGSTLQNYRQNCWRYFPDGLVGSNTRIAYYTQLSALGKTRLYNAIARKAYELSLLNRVTPLGYVLSAVQPTHWSLCGKRSTFKHFD
jgi:hypothetical protein